MAPKTPSQTTQTTKVELPKWVDKASEENYKLAKTLGETPYQQYNGQTVADLSTNESKAAWLANTGTGGINRLMGQSTAAYDDAGGIFKNINDLAGGLKSKSVNDYNVDDYMNPYVDNVETKALDALDRSRQMSVMGNASAAGAAKAFGGSRHGVVDAITNSESAREAGSLSANLRKDAYDNAMGLIQGDRQNEMDTFLSKTNAMGTAGQGMLQTGAGYNANAQTQQQARMQDIASLLQTGGLVRQNDQAKLDADRELFDGKRNYDIDNLNLRLSALGMSPYGKSETSVKTGTGGNSGTDFGQLGMGLFSMLLGFSEDNAKTDKEKIGKLPGSDLDLWAWRYKKDPKTYPKSVGLMVSDVEKKMPEFVHKLESGNRVLNYGGIMAKVMENG